MDSNNEKKSWRKALEKLGGRGTMGNSNGTQADPGAEVVRNLISLT